MSDHGCWQSREQRMHMAHSTPGSPAPWRSPSLSPLFLPSGWRQTQPGPLLPVDTNLLTELALVAHEQSEIRWCFKYFNKIACLEQKTCHISYRFQCEQQLWVAENDAGERDSKAEAEEEQHKRLSVELGACCVPVWSTGTLQALWDIPGKTNSSLQQTCLF